MANPWLVHLKKVYAKVKKQGKSYKQAMVIAKSSYKKSAGKKKKVSKIRGRRSDTKTEKKEPEAG